MAASGVAAAAAGPGSSPCRRAASSRPAVCTAGSWGGSCEWRRPLCPSGSSFPAAQYGYLSEKVTYWLNVGPSLVQEVI